MNPQLTRAEILYELKDIKTPLTILEYIAKKTRSPIKKRGRRINIYDSLNDKALNIVYNAFVKCEVDRAGKFLEFRLAKHMMKQYKNICKVDFRKKLVGASRAIHEIDVAGYDEEGNLIAVGEGKARGSVAKDHIIKWSKIVEDLLRNKEYTEDLYRAYFISTGSYTDDAIHMIKDMIDKEGKFETKTGWLTKAYINVYFVEEREGGKIFKVWPK